MPGIIRVGTEQMQFGARSSPDLAIKLYASVASNSFPGLSSISSTTPTEVV